MWVLDWADRKIYAYDMQSKERVPAMDYHLAGPAGHSDLKGVWSDGTTMWVAHAIDDKIYAYNMPAAATGTVSLANLDGLLAASGENSQQRWRSHVRVARRRDGGLLGL